MKIAEIIEISDKEWNEIQSLFQYKTIKKKTIIQREGEVFDDVYYLKSGKVHAHIF